MTLNEYQAQAHKTSHNTIIGSPIVYPAIGLANEAGELLGKVKKLYRDYDGVMDDQFRLSIVMELGDVLWYVSETAEKLGCDLEEVAKLNLGKLLNRSQRGTLRGDGDDR